MDLLWFRIKIQFAEVLRDYFITSVKYSVFHFLAKSVAGRCSVAGMRSQRDMYLEKFCFSVVAYTLL